MNMTKTAGQYQSIWNIEEQLNLTIEQPRKPEQLEQKNQLILIGIADQPQQMK
jgi:hypothetical protein